MSFSMIDGKTRWVGLLGHPVSHSVSPQMHNAAFSHLGLPFVYLAWDCSPASLKEGIQGLRALGFGGANVTIPHKELVMDSVDQLSPLAQRVGSVNTLYWEENQLIGTTTDGLGAFSHLRSEGVEVAGQELAVLGYGGSAKAIAHAAVVEGVRRIRLCGRDEKKAQALLDSLVAVGAEVDFVPIEQFRQKCESSQLIVHTTPLGMTPNVNSSALTRQDLHPGQIVYDIVYNPRQTQLLQEAQSAGCRGIGGLGMLVHQGAISQEFWTGCKAPVDVMMAAAERALK